MVATFFDFSPTVLLQNFGMLVLGLAVGYTVHSIERNMYRAAVERWIQSKNPSKSDIYQAMHTARKNRNFTLRCILKSHVRTRSVLA